MCPARCVYHVPVLTGLRPSERDTRLHLANRLHEMDGARGSVPGVVREAGRYPELHMLRKIEGRRHNTNDGVRLRIERQRPADDVGIAAEALLPETAPDHDGRSGARLVFGLRKDTPEFGGSRQHREQTGGYLGAQCVDRLVIGPDREFVGAEQRQVFEGRGAALPVLKVQRTDAHSGAKRAAFMYAHQPIRIGVRRRPQQNCIYNAEDRRICADAQGQRQ